MTRLAQAAPGGGSIDKGVVLLVTSIASFLTPFTMSSINVALPSIASDLGMDAVTLSWMATATVMATAASMIPFGKISDIYGRKKMFLYRGSQFRGHFSPVSRFRLAITIFTGLCVFGVFASLARGNVRVETGIQPPPEVP